MEVSRKRLITFILICSLLAVIVAIAVAVPLSLRDSGGPAALTTLTPEALVDKVLQTYPVVDGHNDLAWQYRARVRNDVENVTFNLNVNLSQVFHNLHTDIPRLRKGGVGAQFWSCIAPCSSQYTDSVRFSLDQLDTIKRFVSKYPDAFTFVTTAKGIEDAVKANRIASLVGLEGGHSIDNSLATLRMFYDLGVRYMTLTHNCNTPWADNWKCDYSPSSSDYSCEPKVWNGLSPWGEKLITEMNRMGMLVDLSHVSKATMEDALRVSTAPVIFSHTSSYTRCNHYRNVQDDVLAKVKTNGGIVMVGFYDIYINCPPNKQIEATLSQVAEHIDHIKNITGIDHVGLGGDYDGGDTLPKGLEDVSTYPDLLVYLVKQFNWTEEMLQKLTMGNLLRVFKKAEEVARNMQSTRPNGDEIPAGYLAGTNSSCRPDF